MSESSDRPGTRRPIFRRLLPLLALIAFLSGALVVVEAGSGALFLARAAIDADLEDGAITEETHTLRRGDREIPVRIYRPADGFHRTLVLAHGVHHEGIEDQRLQSFCRRMAEGGFAVVTPDLADLKSYDLAASALDDLQTAALWALDRDDLRGEADDDRIAMMGVSFGGGLALSVAARPELANRVAAVFTLGGHGDLDRTIHYLATGKGPSGAGPPHVYGQAVLLRRLAADLLPPGENASSCRAALAAYLRGEETEARALAHETGPRTEAWIAACMDRDTETLGQLLAPHVATTRFDPLLSPIRGSVPRCPVFILHGRLDNVIPASEARAVAAWAEPHTRTHLIVSDQVIHVEFSDELPTPFEAWELARMLTRFLKS